MSITKKLVLSFLGIIFLVIAVLGPIGSHLISRLEVICNELWGRTSSVKAVDNLQFCLSKLHLPLMRYVATGRKDNLYEFKDEVSECKMRLIAVSEDLFVPEEDRTKVASMMKDLKSVIALGDEIATLNLSEERNLANRKLEVIDDIIGKMLITVGSVDERLHRRLHQIKKSGQKVTSEAFNIFVFVLLGITGFAILVSLLLSHKIVRPIIYLKEGTQRLAGGDLNFKLDITSKDEIGNLADSFNKMVDELKRTMVSKDYVDNIIKNMIDTLIVIDAEGKIKTVNPATAQLLGYKEEELIGKPVTLIFEDGTEAPLTNVNIRKVLEKGFVKNHRMRYKLKSGGRIPVTFSGSVMRDKNGRFVGIVGIARDMREILRLMEKEKGLAVANATVQAEQKRSAELQEAYKKLEQMQEMLIQAEKMSAIGELASGIAHEVKNPLAIIIQGVDYLEKNLKPQKGISEVLSMVKKNVKRADHIIRALVDFSRIGVAQLKPEDINTILEGSLTLTRYSSRLENIEVIKDLDRNLPKVYADKEKMEQAFINILLNAIHAMPNGGRLYLTTKLTQLNEVKDGVGRRASNHFKVGEKAVLVSIKDTGSGIPKEHLRKIFDPFFTTKEVGKGSGLGLSVTKNIISMHKGLIEVKSKEGEGTEIDIYLKLAQTKEA